MSLSRPPRRREDARHLTGRGLFTDDLECPGQAWAAFYRSPYARARIVSLDLGAARAAPGVLGVQVATRARPHADSSIVEIGAASVRRRTGFDSWDGATGRGAIIGFVDSGIDYRHADFRTDDFAHHLGGEAGFALVVHHRR